MQGAVLIRRDFSAIRIWLITCAVLVALMVLVGGYTRLSGSGLSITEWKPIHGVIPPTNKKAWEEEFIRYRGTPQYQKINSSMTLKDFKRIYWPEFTHRALGRLIGAVFFLPLIAFAFRKSISRGFGLRLAGIFVLGGLQGLIGWLMVASGLVDTPYVSHVRLALHLFVAFTIFALLVWAILDVSNLSQNTNKSKQAIVYYKLWFSALCFQIFLGAFVAGLHAGLVYNTFPTMNGQWLPEGFFSMTPWYDNFLLNHTLIQFMHRWLAVLVAGGFAIWWYQWRDYVKDNGLGKYASLVGFALAAQFTLGVLTLLNQAPLPLALAHQMTALLLFAASVIVLHRVCKS